MIAHLWKRPIWLLLTTMLAAGFSPAALVAQATGTLEGRIVVDRSEQPLASVQVVIQALGMGTLSNQDGRFRLTNVPAGTHTVTAIRIGLSAASETVTVTPGEVTVVNFTLQQRALDLDAIVVTGQGSEISRRRLSTNIDVVSTDQIQNSPATRLDQLLQTALPSVQVRLASGQPGATSVTRGRGPVSAARSTTPVIYVDGVRVDNLNTQAELSLNTSGNRRQGTQTSAIADIPLENIERIEYVPGGAATTLYGSDAANGVIQIFTNKGAPGPAQFSVETEVGLETPNKAYFWFPQTVDLLYRNALRQQHRLTASGGSADVTWSLSGSIQDREGYRIGNNASTSYQVRSGIAAQFSSSVNYAGSFSYANNAYERTRDGNAGGYAPLWLLEAGRVFAYGVNNDLRNMTSEQMARLREFVNEAERLQDNQIRVSRFQFSHALNWQARDDLSFRATFGLDQRVSNERGILSNAFLNHTAPRNIMTALPVIRDDRGSLSSFDRRFLGMTFEAGGQHRFDRGDLSVVTSSGGQLFREDDQQNSRVAQNVRDGSQTIRGAGTITADDFLLQVVNYGVYLQQNYGLYDRYFLDVGLRADANSGFGEDVGFQYYPKVGFSYDVGSEEFFRNIFSGDAVASFRLRGNYGVAGNFPAAFARDRTVNFNSYLGNQSAASGQPGNPDLGPEKTYTYEFGADAELFAGRASLQFNWYDATTRDALFLVPSTPSFGEGSQFRNVGEISNNGVEIRLSARVLETDRYSARLGGSFNTLNNLVVSSGGSPTFGISGFSSSTVEAVVEEGLPLGSLRGSKATLNPDGSVASVELLQYLGKPLPDQFGTLNAEFTVGRNLRFNMDADWQRGAQLHSFDRQFRYQYLLDDPRLPAGLIASAPTTATARTNWLQLTNFFVEDTDYLIIRNLAASYTLPARLLGSRAKSATLGLAIQNPYGWWTSTFNPETDHSGAASQGGATVGGFNYGSDPSPRTFLMNLRVRF